MHVERVGLAPRSIAGQDKSLPLGVQLEEWRQWGALGGPEELGWEGGGRESKACSV